MGYLMVLDDNPDERTILADMLALRGFRVATCASSEEAIPKILSDPPDFLLLDLRLHGRSGFDLLLWVRRHAPGLGVIVLTAVRSAEMRREVLALGALACIEKPVNLLRLIGLLDRQSAAA